MHGTVTQLEIKYRHPCATTGEVVWVVRAGASALRSGINRCLEHWSSTHPLLAPVADPSCTDFELIVAESAWMTFGPAVWPGQV